MEFEENDTEYFPLSQVGVSQSVVLTPSFFCHSTPGACGCMNCEKQKSNPFAKKVLTIHDNKAVWVWQQEMLKKYELAKAEQQRWNEYCESIYGYCGCEDCNRIFVHAQQKGLEDIIFADHKYMDLDTGKFIWNYGEVEKKLGIKF